MPENTVTANASSLVLSQQLPVSTHVNAPVLQTVSVVTNSRQSLNSSSSQGFQPVPDFQPYRSASVSSLPQPNMADSLWSASALYRSSSQPALPSLLPQNSYPADKQQLEVVSVLKIDAKEPPKKNTADALDNTSPHVSNITRNMLKSIPCFTQNLFQQTLLRHKAALQNIIGKKNLSKKDALSAENALNFFSATPHLSRLKRTSDKINNNANIPAADKIKMQALIGQSAAKALAEIKKRQPPFLPVIAQLPSALNSDLVELLVKFGLTHQQLLDVIHHDKIIDTMTNLNLFVTRADRVDVVLERSGQINTITEEIKNEIKVFYQQFAESMFKINKYLGKYIYLRLDSVDCLLRDTLDDDYDPGNFDRHTSVRQLNEQSTPQVNALDVFNNRIIYLMQIKFMHGSQLLNLYRTISEYNPLTTKRSELNPEQLKWMSALERDEIGKMLNPQYGARVRCLLSGMEVAPFILGDGLARPEMNYDTIPLGHRGISFSELDKLITNEKISEERLNYIGIYSNYCLERITTTGRFPVDWMESLNEATLAHFYKIRNDLCYNFSDGSHFALGAALEEIGRVIIGNDFTIHQLAEFFDWCKTRLPPSVRSISDNDLACLLFSHTPDYMEPESIGYDLWEIEPSLISLAAQLVYSRSHDKDADAIKLELEAALEKLIAKVITPRVLSEVQRPETIRQQVNELLSRDDILSFMAQRLTVPIIEEDALGDFLRGSDSVGTIFEAMPEENTAALILRPDTLISLDAAGVAQETIDIAYHDHHSLLREMLRYSYARDGIASDDDELDQALVMLEQELLASEKVQGKLRFYQ